MPSYQSPTLPTQKQPTRPKPDKLGGPAPTLDTFDPPIAAPERLKRLKSATLRAKSFTVAHGK